MNPIPPGVMPTQPVDGHLDLLTLVALAALFIMLGVTIWRLWQLNRQRPAMPGGTRPRVVVFGAREKRGMP